MVCIYEAACVDREQMLANVRLQFALLALGCIAGMGSGWNRVEAERGQEAEPGTLMLHVRAGSLPYRPD